MDKEFPQADVRSMFFGFLISVGYIVPLFGRIGGKSSIVMSALILIVATLFVPIGGTKPSRQLRPWIILVCLFTAYATLVALHAFKEQWGYLLAPRSWIDHSSDYVDAKFLMFLITSLPALYAATLVYLFGNRKTTTGLIVGLISVALCAAGRTVIDGYQYLAGTDYMTSRLFLMNPERPYSTVSYGILFVIGAICSLATKRLWPLASLFLFMSAWLDRKTETVIISFAIISAAAYAVLLHQRSLSRATLRTTAQFSIALALFVPLHNQANLDTWRYLSDNIHLRMAIIENRAINETSVAFIKESAKRIRTRLHGSDDNKPVSGLGSFAINSANPDVPYPHNLLIETYLEIGILATLLIVSMFVFSVVFATRRLLVRYQPEIFSILLTCGAVFTISMKAGDITNVGRIVFFSITCLTARNASQAFLNIAPPTGTAPWTPPNK